MQPEIRSAQASSTGLVRANNEDSVGIFESVDKAGSPHNLYLVCDGMGGHQAGEIASKIVVQEVVQAYAIHLAEHTPDIALQLAVQHAHGVLRTRADVDADLHSMGTTAVIASLYQDSLHIANIGDSRAYLLQSGQLEQITTDHSQVKSMVDAGTITELEATKHKYRSILTRSMSASHDSIQPDIFHRDFRDGDTLLLCSDGLWSEVSHSQIEHTVSRLPPEKAVEALVKLANRAGGSDNISTIVVHRGPLHFHEDAKTQEMPSPEREPAARIPAWTIALIMLTLAGLALLATYWFNWPR